MDWAGCDPTYHQHAESTMHTRFMATCGFNPAKPPAATERHGDVTTMLDGGETGVGLAGNFQSFGISFRGSRDGM
ncbi:hypothetical protein C8035_v007012 [Colletotrichum spinosum]|uniref:Uncharacterized protein n=1 Tax=Colletotrichum spinosum TaxID=1347390 RepID=A0A4R8QF24_9PEZI|nr:hypothetical protein C8035_v007012 [Colletotrichum spinosum]